METEFSKKLKEVIELIMIDDPYEEDVDEPAWHKEAHIARNLQYYIANWPWIALMEDYARINGNGEAQSYRALEIEEVDTENIEMEIFDTHVHIAAGGDWQAGTDFDVVLNKDPKTNVIYPFMACNIRYMADINGERD